MPDMIRVDTDALEGYAHRLHQVNGRIRALDHRMDSLYRNAGLLDMVTILRADLLVSYSRRLKSCEDYLRHTATAFENAERQLSRLDPTAYQPKAKAGGVGRASRGGGKSVVEQVRRGIGKAVAKGASKVKSRVDGAIRKAKAIVDSAVESALESYLQQGTVYKIFQYGRVVRKAVGAVSKIVIGATAAATPVGVVLGFCSIASGLNDLYNCGGDIALIRMGKYDQVGKDNGLRNLLGDMGGDVGAALGNRKAGEKIGQRIAFGIDLGASIHSLGRTYGEVKEATSTDFKALAGEFKQIRHTPIGNIMNTDVKDLANTYKQTTNFFKNVGLLYKVGDNSVSVGKSAHSLLTLGDESKSNPIIDYLDGVSTNVTRISTGGKVITTATRFAFG